MDNMMRKVFGRRERARSERAEQEQKGLELGNEISTEKAREVPVLRQLVDRDGLTGLENRRAFENRMEPAFASSLVSLAGKEKRVDGTEPKVMSIIMCDIDHFKRINDTYGHGAGDKVLTEVAKRLKELLPRGTDCVARYGGEEFVVGLVGATEEQTFQKMESVRNDIQDFHVNVEGKPISITMSFGVTSSTNGAKNLSEAMEQADKALYDAKNGGRNRTVLFSNIDSALSRAAQKGSPSWNENRGN